MDLAGNGVSRIDDHGHDGSGCRLPTSCGRSVHASIKLSLGYVIDRLARAVGWSPVAKRVVISGVEGPSASVFEGVIGTVRSIQGSVMTLEPDRTVHPGGRPGSLLRLTARHQGWTPYSLCLKPIAVVVEAEPSGGGSGPVAIGVVTILR